MQKADAEFCPKESLIEKTKSSHSFFELVSGMNRFKGYGKNILEGIMQR